MKTENLTLAVPTIEPARANFSEMLTETVAGASTFVYCWPYAAVRGYVREACAALTDYWQARGFNVAGCSSITTANRKIRPGEAWIIWDNQSKRLCLRVLVMRAGMGPGQ